MHHPYSGETYTAMPDGTCEIRCRITGDVGYARLSDDGESFTVVSGSAPRATLHLIKWAMDAAAAEQTS